MVQQVAGSLSPTEAVPVGMRPKRTAWENHCQFRTAQTFGSVRGDYHDYPCRGGDASPGNRHRRPKIDQRFAALQSARRGNLVGR